jgi:hypothetical protein
MNNTTGSSQIHLIVETPAGASVAARAVPDAPLPALPVPVDVVSFDPKHPPQLRSVVSAVPAAGVLLEPVVTPDGQLRLLLVHSGNGRLRLNGNSAPRISLLRERDQFEWDDACVFHVAIFHRPNTGPAPADTIGKPCPICLTPFTENTDSICYRCPCGTVLHLQDPSGLECARAVHDCPHCHQPVSLKEGYYWLPKLDA